MIRDNAGAHDLRQFRWNRSERVGISPEIRDQLFQPFVSFGKKNGMGLGLALSRQSILDHGGDMWAERGATGGACFKIRLPRKSGAT